jgi:hypothetical protein
MTASSPTVGEPIDPNDKPSGATYLGSKRPLYFTEQFLVVEDFKDEEHYHLGLTRRHNRCLHTPGVVAGLEVTVQAQPRASGPTTLTVGSGSAIDNFGREIILAAPATITFDAPGGRYERYVVISFGEVKSTDESDTKVPTGGRPGVKRAVQAPMLHVTDTDPRTQWPRNLDDDRVLIGKLIRDGNKSPVSYQAGAGARIPTGGALSFQQAVVDPADARQQTAPPVQMGVDFADSALRIRARVTDPVNLDTTRLVIEQATGNVGISTINPAARLTIQQGEANKKALLVSGDGGASIYNQAGNAGIDLLPDRITAAVDNQSLTIAARGTGALLLNPAGGNLGMRTAGLNLANTGEVLLRIIKEYPDPLPDPGRNPHPFLKVPVASGAVIKETDLKVSDGIFQAMFKESAQPLPRTIITGDVIIVGRLLVTGISEYGGKVFRRGGQA